MYDNPPRNKVPWEEASHLSLRPKSYLKKLFSPQKVEFFVHFPVNWMLLQDV